MFFRPVLELEIYLNLFSNLFEKERSEISMFLNKHPYIFLMEIDRIKKNNFLLFKFGMSVNQIYKVFQENSVFMFQNPNNNAQILKNLNDLGLKDQVLANIIAKNPFILTMTRPTMYLPMVKFWKGFGFNQEGIGRLFVMYPFLITKSVTSTKTKLAFLYRDFHIDMQSSPITSKLLNYSFSRFIEPRGLVMIKNKCFDWNEVIDLTDEAFCKKFNENLDEFRTKAGAKGKKDNPRTFEGMAKDFSELNGVSNMLRQSLYFNRHM